MTSIEEPTLTIDIVSDFACPWCYIGYRRLMKALEHLNITKYLLRWHPYEISCRAAAHPDSESKEALYVGFFGAERAALIMDRVASEAVAEGIDIKFDGKNGNTLACHKLVYYLARQLSFESQSALAVACFQANFEKSRDQSDSNVLVDQCRSVVPELSEETIMSIIEGESDDLFEEALYNAQQYTTCGIPVYILSSLDDEERFTVVGPEPPQSFIHTITSHILPGKK